MPHEIAPGYVTEAELSPGTHRCADAAGRRWVLKRLPDDCLHDGGLHPAIRDRLARVRELAHARVATLAGVVRGGGGAYLVWAHVDGVPLGAADLSAARFHAVAGRLAAAVDTLHARGLVHGALTPGNVIVTPAGDVWLTHLSPYLWADETVDAAAVVELLRPAAAALSLDVPADPPATLADLAHGWSRPPPAAVPNPPRGRWLLAAAGVAAAAVAAAVAVARHVGR